MAGAKVNITYFRPGPLDIIMEREQGRELEFGLKLLVEKMREDGADDEQIAVNLVEESCRSYGAHPYQNADGTITFKSEVDVDIKYLRPDYWKEKSTKPEYTKDFWLQKYCNKDLSRAIPEDRIDRMVLYFLQDYLKVMFYKYILDKDICENERLAVLKKQLENFSFYSRRKPFGGIWKVSSEPNKLLREALRSREDSDSGSSENDDPEKAVSAQEEGNSDKFVDSGVHLIGGIPVFVEADKSIPGDAGDGPKLDSVDKDIFNGVQQYAKTRLQPDAVHKSWTMVRCGLQVPTKTPFRCYAFSGHAQSAKELHSIPVEWWGQCKDKPKNTEIVNVDASQFGHNMVLALFTALKPAIKEDLSKLVSHIVLEENEDARHLIMTARQDIVVLDYGAFYDHVISLLSNCDEKIKTSINRGISRLVPSGKKLTNSEEIWKCVSVGGYNKQFGPNKERLFKLLSEQFEQFDPKLTEQISDIMVRISRRILSEFETEIKELPEVYLGTLLKELQTSRCAEDNAIGSVLRRLLLQNNTDAFLNTSVTFVAMDANNEDGKPFCSVCAVKVRFYSVLPMLLRAIGSTGKDFDELAPLFAQLRKILHHPNSA